MISAQCSFNVERQKRTAINDGRHCLAAMFMETGRGLRHAHSQRIAMASNVVSKLMISAQCSDAQSGVIETSAGNRLEGL